MDGDRESDPHDGEGALTTARRLDVDDRIGDIDCEVYESPAVHISARTRPEFDEDSVVDVDDDASATRRIEKTFPVSWPRIVFETCAVAGIAWIYVTWLYRLWRVPLRIPLYQSGGGDLLQNSALIKGIIANGWFQHNPSLNAPFGQQYYDFPMGGESLQWLAIKMLSLFTKDVGLIYNFYYLAGFGLDAAVAYIVLRHLRLGPFVSGVVALIFAFLPFHVWHSEFHLMRVAYISVPLGALLLVWLAQWRARFLRDPLPVKWFGGRENVRWRRLWAAVMIGVGIGAWETMTTLFAIILIGISAIIGAIRWREWRRIAVGIVLATPIAAGFIAGNAGTLLFWLQNGKNEVAGQRDVFHVEQYGLKISRMILPSDGSRLPWLSQIAYDANKMSPVGVEGGQSIGLIAVLGLAGLLYFAAAGVRARRTRQGGDLRHASNRAALRETASLVVLVAIILGTVGGLSTILSMLGLSQLRTWARIVLYVALFCLVQVALWVSSLSAWSLRTYGDRVKPILAVGLVCLLALGWADGPAWPVPQVAENVAQFSSDRVFTGQIDAVLPPGSAVMQYPVMTFPEHGPLQGMNDYDPMRAYLADQGSLRWSYGGIEGRPDADWQATLTRGDNEVNNLPAVVGMGFTGLWIDTAGYTKTPKRLAALRSALGTIQPIVSPDQRFLFYDLRPYRATLAQTDDQLRSIAVKTFGVSPP